MARNLAELKKECLENNVPVVRSGKREAKADYEKALAKFYWQRDHGDEPMPPQIHPMLARNSKDLSDEEVEFMWNSARYVAQEKIDGCRLLMFIGPMGNYFTSRRLSDRTYRYAENTEQVPHLSHTVFPRLIGTVLDGEICSTKAVVDTGKTVTLNHLQAAVAILALKPAEAARVQAEQDAWLVYKVFDIISYKGEDLTNRPYHYRISKLGAVIQEIHQTYADDTNGNWAASKIEQVPTLGIGKKEFYEEVVRRGGEGIMLKDIDAPYEASSSRTKAMWKVKRFEEIDGFVTGFAPGEQGAGWEKLVGGLEVSCFDEVTRAIHPSAWVTNLTFDQRCEATVCPQCGVGMKVDWENQAGKRVVTGVRCLEHGEQAPALNKDWYNKVLLVRGQEFTSRVFRLKHAAIISERNDKPVEECTINLSAIKAKFDSKASETGISL